MLDHGTAAGRLPIVRSTIKSLPFMLYFEIQTGKHRGKRLKLAEGEFVIGRDEGVSLRITSSEVSRRHCIIKVSQHQVLIEDLDSRNGTFINGFPIKGTVAIQPGSELTVGPMSFRLHDSRTKGGERTGDKKDVDTSLSDDDIATWLSGDIPAVATSDTTIITNSPQPASSAPKPPAPIPPRKKREFRSVAEEGQDIIRRFLEMQSASPSDSEGA